MKKLLVTGISGFLGWYIKNHPQDNWDIYGFYHHNKSDWKNTYGVDLGAKNQVHDLLENIQPDAILHIAALSNPNQCEDYPDWSKRINVDAGLHLGSYAKAHKIPMIFSSTDLVFDGKNAPYDEMAATNPLNTYGQHKVQGEQALIDLYPEACIARLPLLYGHAHQSNCFFSSWLEKLKSGESINAFTDEYRTAVDGVSAAAGLFLLLEKGVRGIWHLGGAERMSRFDFAIKMAEHFGVDKDLVKPSLQSEIEFKAARAADVSLDSGKAFALGYHPFGIDASLLNLL